MGLKLAVDLSNRIDERLGCLEVLQTDWKGNPLATRATAACIGNGDFLDECLGFGEGEPQGRKQWT